MSYSAFIPAAVVDGVPLVYTDPRRSATAPEIFSIIKATPMPTGQCSADVWEAAKSAAISIIESGSVGGPDKAFSVTISGHANTDHEPVDGWTNDFVQVAVHQAAVATDES